MKLGVTVRPPDTAWSSVTVNMRESPSAATTSAMVTAAASSSKISPVASVAVTANDVPATLRPTVKVSSDSLAASSLVCTLKLCVSPAVPANESAAVFSA